MIFVKRRPSLVCSSVVRPLLLCLSFIFTFMNISDQYQKLLEIEIEIVREVALGG